MMHRFIYTPIALACAMGISVASAGTFLPAGDKLLLTGGVSQIEGAAGGGLTPWAVIGGYGTRDQIGGNAFYTRVEANDYALDSFGAAVGLYDRVELSIARQSFNTQDVGTLLGVGKNFKFKQDIYGIKVKLIGDVVYDQDSWLPQISVGLQHKRNDQGAIVRAVGAKDDSGTDYYLTATKLYLPYSTLVNATVRATKANQIGLLGFGGDKNNSYKAEFEGSVAYLLSKNLAVGVEYRMKPDNLGFAKEDDWKDVFIAWAPTKNVSLTAAYVDLGNVAIRDKQKAVYVSAQIGF